MFLRHFATMGIWCGSWLFPAMLLFITACSSSGESRIDRGTSHAFEVGHPEVRARVTSFFDDEGLPVSDLNLELPHQNLVFRTMDGNRTAETEIRILYRKAETGNLVKRINENLSIRENASDPVFTSLFNHRAYLEPGRYNVEVTVTDVSSRKPTTVQLQVNIPDQESKTAAISDIRVKLLGNGTTRPITSYLIPAAKDSLRFELFVTRKSEDVPARLRMRLIEYNSDTSPARAMGQLPVSSGSIIYRGIDYSNQTILEEQERTLDRETGPVLIEYLLPRPDRGNYRIEVELTTDNADGESETSTRFREFGIVSSNFPRVQSVLEMAEPLAYLMRERDFRNMMRIEEPDSMLQVVDRFWLQDMTPRMAREQIQRFYTRVEEANRLFSGFKEGWKTDMGLVYILMGPPLYVENNMEVMIWHYSYNRMDPRTVIIFERTRVTGNSWPFNHYILVRNRFYQGIELEAINNWTSGRIPRIN
ncbi:MAG: GWxTD domain-containing protein [Balneolales bacterium]|nr:GWxTD domain-containing protein [Balneolales bacterium]